MSKLTLDEAIKHCLEVAEQNEKKAEYRPRMDYYDEIESRTDCLECAADHKQLAEWLTELKEAKRLLKLAVEDLEELHSEADCSCNCCKGEKAESCQFVKCWTWRYADEALKLIGDEPNGI